MKNRMLSLNEMQDAAQMIENIEDASYDAGAAVTSCIEIYGPFITRLLLVAHLRAYGSRRKRPAKSKIAAQVAKRFKELGLKWHTFDEAKSWSDEELDEKMEQAGVVGVMKDAVRYALGRSTTKGWRVRDVGHWETALIEAYKKLGIEFLTEE